MAKTFDEDSEVINIVNQNFRRARKAEEVIYADAVYEQVEDDGPSLGDHFARFAGCCLRAGVGTLFLFAAREGLIDPYFAVVLACACAVWTVYYFRHRFA